MTVEERLEKALQSPEADKALSALVHQLAAAGQDKAAIIALLENFLVQHRTRPDYRESQEDILLGILDALTGWCHPSAWLLPEEPV
jgi:hypothetical protein